MGEVFAQYGRMLITPRGGSTTLVKTTPLGHLQTLTEASGPLVPGLWVPLFHRHVYNFIILKVPCRKQLKLCGLVFVAARGDGHALCPAGALNLSPLLSTPRQVSPPLWVFHFPIYML